MISTLQETVSKLKNDRTVRARQFKLIKKMTKEASEAKAVENLSTASSHDDSIEAQRVNKKIIVRQFKGKNSKLAAPKTNLRQLVKK